jgi:hypothetical protein
MQLSRPAFWPKTDTPVIALEEFNCATRAVQNVALQLLNDRRVGDHRLPDDAFVVLLGNRPEDRVHIEKLSSAVVNRIVNIRVRLDLEDWIKWAHGNSVEPIVIAFLRFRPDLLTTFDGAKWDGISNFASPRTWEKASAIIAHSRDGEVRRALLDGALGQGAAAEFLGFVGIWEKLPNLDTVLNNSTTAPVPEDPYIKVVRVKVRTYKQGGWGEFEEQAGCAEDGPDGKGKGRSPDEMAVEWDRRVVQAATAARMQKGNLPGCIEKLVNRIVNPRVPWERLLERFVENTADADYSWQRPDRRFLPEDIIIPEIHDTTLGEIVVAIDTSASIFRNGRALDSFEAEINAIILECRPKNVTVIYCDTRVTGVEEYGSGERIQIKAKGGGGTDFRPVGAYIKLHNISPCVCIYLTDLAGTFPDGPWDFPTIWCVYGNSRKRAPFGDTVHISKYYP